MIEAVSKVPILGDIPIFGALFKRFQNTTAKTELLIFLTPHVAYNPYALRRISKDEKDGIQILDKAVEGGALESQLEGMARGKAPDADARNAKNEEFYNRLQREAEERLRREAEESAAAAAESEKE